MIRVFASWKEQWKIVLAGEWLALPMYPAGGKMRSTHASGGAVMFAQRGSYDGRRVCFHRSRQNPDLGRCRPIKSWRRPCAEGAPWACGGVMADRGARLIAPRPPIATWVAQSPAAAVASGPRALVPPVPLVLHFDPQAGGCSALSSSCPAEPRGRLIHALSMPQVPVHSGTTVGDCVS